MLFKFISLFCALTAAFAVRISEQEYQYQWSNYLVRFPKVFPSAYEHTRRYDIFKTNYHHIVEHNAAASTSWTLGVNEFADLTWDEFRTRYIGTLRHRFGRVEATLDGDAPDSIDWTLKGAVTPVKNQEQCGSCWAFSTTGAVEGAVAVKTGRLTSLSEQQLVDCSGAYGNLGCNGGLMDNAFQYIIENHGLCAESEYPYTAADGTCKKCSPVSTISSFVDVPRNNQTALKLAVAQQPVSVAIEADQLDFQFYSGGVFSGTCGTNLDHGVLVVGYGQDNGQLYWKVKNSWGDSWGEKGYILLARQEEDNSPGQCGVAMEPSYPVV